MSLMLFVRFWCRWKRCWFFCWCSRCCCILIGSCSILMIFLIWMMRCVFLIWLKWKCSCCFVNWFGSIMILFCLWLGILICLMKIWVLYINSERIMKKVLKLLMIWLVFILISRMRKCRLCYCIILSVIKLMV